VLSGKITNSLESLLDEWSANEKLKDEPLASITLDLVGIQSSTEPSGVGGQIRSSSQRQER
jgi:hypothetical protein